MQNDDRWFGVRSLIKESELGAIEERIILSRAPNRRQALLRAFGESCAYVGPFPSKTILAIHELFPIVDVVVPSRPILVFQNTLHPSVEPEEFISRWLRTSEYENTRFQTQRTDYVRRWKGGPIGDSELGIEQADEWYGVRISFYDSDTGLYTQSTWLTSAPDRKNAVEQCLAMPSEGNQTQTVLPLVQSYATHLPSDGMVPGLECFSVIRDATDVASHLDHFYPGVMDLSSNFRDGTQSRAESESIWHGVRSVMTTSTAGEYVERVTAWRATSAEDAREMALGDAQEYARDLFELFDTGPAIRLDSSESVGLRQGIELRNLDHQSELAPEEFVAALGAGPGAV